MNDQPGSSQPTQEQPSWLEKILHTFSNQPKDRKALLDILREAQERELLDAASLGMIERIFQFSDMQVRDVMIPRPQMVIAELDQKPDVFIPKIIASGHSRFPATGSNREEILGILLAKDLLNYCYHGRHSNFEELLRPAVFIPESKRLGVLLDEFRINRNHMAIVVNEYGGIAGLITIEDVLEQIVGEIEDETDIDAEDQIKKYSEKNYTVKAHTEIETFNEYFKSKFSDEEFDTIGGFVTHKFGHLPKRGETITIEKLEFKVLNADNRRIRLLQVTPI